MGREPRGAALGLTIIHELPSAGKTVTSHNMAIQGDEPITYVQRAVLMRPRLHNATPPPTAIDVRMIFRASDLPEGREGDGLGEQHLPSPPP